MRSKREEYLIINSNPNSKPTRDQIINVKTDFANLRDNDDIPIFTPFILTLLQNNPGKAEDWLNLLSDDTHISLSISYDYNENLGWAPRYPIDGFDFTSNLSLFKNLVKQIISRGKIPDISLACDGQGIDPNGGTKGWQWGMNNIPR